MVGSQLTGGVLQTLSCCLKSMNLVPDLRVDTWAAAPKTALVICEAASFLTVRPHRLAPIGQGRPEMSFELHNKGGDGQTVAFPGRDGRSNRYLFCRQLGPAVAPHEGCV